MKVHETRSSTEGRRPMDDDKIMTRKQKAEQQKAASQQQQQSPKKPRQDNNNGRQPDRKSSNEQSSSRDFPEDYKELRKATEENLSVDQMREILQANDQDGSGSDGLVITKCQDLLYYGPLGVCPICGSNLEFDGGKYLCKGSYSEWATCTYSSRNPPRKEEPTKLPDSVLNSPAADLLKKYRDPRHRPKKDLGNGEKVFQNMVISLSGRMSRKQETWKEEIEKHGGKVNGSVIGVNCLVAAEAERDRGGSSKISEAVERGVQVVREQWLLDCIERQELQPLSAYDMLSDLAVEGRGIPWDKQDPGEEALESLTAEIKLYGKRGVYKDTKLSEKGGTVFERDGVVYSCAFSQCNLGRGVNEYCILQLITVPGNNLNLYFKRGKVGDDPGAEERLEEWVNVDNAVKEFTKLFETITGNEFEPWEREKKFQKKPFKFHLIDMDDGVDARHGGLDVRQLGVAAAHSRLEPRVAFLMKVLCSREIYRYALMEMGHDPPDLPMGMLSQFHLKKCEEVLLEFVEKLKSDEGKGQRADVIRSDYSQRWFTLMHSTRPFILRNYQEIADYAAAAFETVKDITDASHIIGDMTGDTIDDPLSDRYEKLGCEISPVEKDSADYKMIVNYLKKTYEPVKLGDIAYGVSVENVYAVESRAAPSYEEIRKLPNKCLLWCGKSLQTMCISTRESTKSDILISEGTRTSNLMRHLNKGFQPAVCTIPVPGYMFGRAIICSDAAAEAARYGFTAVDRPEGVLVLAIASLGDQVVEVNHPPEDTKSWEEGKIGVKGLGRKKTDEFEHFTWKDDIKVPCGKLIPSDHKDSPLEYNEYAVYDPKQTSIRFLVGVKYEEQGVIMETEE
ncbi:hypothetical protein MLD38_025289 [Melastoma candidum]|uniref:Uncharacterized protein n=1 Tax=Melastoma candidum TaxID=119954 RepID=A0ACB9NXS7_9MYRT|nr:hypothetical protein MLD38_025289 [Melastoma candidum]